MILEDASVIHLEYHQVHKPFSISLKLLIMHVTKSYVCPAECRLQMWAQLGFQPPPVAHSCRIRHEMCTDFRNNPQLRHFSHSGRLLFLKVHEERLVPLDHLFIIDFAIGDRAWVVTSQFPILVSQRSSVIPLMVLVTQLTAILHVGSQVTYHSFLNHRLCFSRLSRTSRCLLRFESVILLVGSLYAETIEALKSRVAISASISNLLGL
jgi:hypothetical protein